MRLLLTCHNPSDSEHLLAQAVNLSYLLGAEIVPVSAIPMGAERPDLVFRETERQVRAMASRGRRLGGTFSSTLVLRFERPETLVSRTASELNADLVLVGNGAGQALSAKIRSVLRVVDRPVWIARAHGSVEVRSILYAGRGGSSPGLDLAAALASRPDAVLNHLGASGPGELSGDPKDPACLGVLTQDLGTDVLVLDTDLPILARLKWVEDTLREIPPTTSVLVVTPARSLAGNRC